MAISLTLFYGSPNAHNGIESAAAAAAFKHAFDTQYVSGEALAADGRREGK
jgi:hypothetical protein